jgi:hypothetical protein
MINRRNLSIGIGLSVLIIATLGWLFMRRSQRSLHFTAQRTDSNQIFSYADYDDVLKTYVDGNGMVNYKRLKAQSTKLDNFAGTMGALNPSIYEKWSEKEKIAFWINAYNGLTLEAIINNYPIKPSITKSLLYPKNSIRQIPGVWDSLLFEVIGKKITLDEIEHKVLRKQFSEPRIHMALVCAAMGCPPLRNEPYVGDKLDEQLDDQTRRFLSNKEKFSIDRSNNRVYLSSIFKWFGEDFINAYGTDQKFSKHSQAERAVLNFISRYLDLSDREFLENGKYTIEYLTYDWSLNEQGGD